MRSERAPASELDAWTREERRLFARERGEYYGTTLADDLEAALTAAQQMRVTPAIRDGDPETWTREGRRRLARERREFHGVASPNYLWTCFTWASPNSAESWPYGMRTMPDTLLPRAPFPSAVNRPALMSWLADRSERPLGRPTADYPGEAVAQSVEGDIQVQAGKMIVTLSFGKGRLTIVKGPSARAQAWVRGSMTGMLNLVTATDLVRPFALRQVHFGGNLLLLLRVLPLVVAPNVLNDRLNELKGKITSLSPL